MGGGYIDKLISKRIPGVYLRFACAVCLFALLRIAIDRPFSAGQFLRALLIWDSLGNSNWYILTILFLYLATFIAFTIFPYTKEDNSYRGVLALCVISTIYIAIMDMNKRTWWYNTMLSYVVGFIFAIEQEKIEDILQNNRNWMIAVVTTLPLFLLCQRIWLKHMIFYQMAACLFAILLILATMKIQIKNPFLHYCGKHLFSLFILQRLPMIAIQKTQIANNVGVYFVTCFVITLVISAIFDYLILLLTKLVLVKR